MLSLRDLYFLFTYFSDYKEYHTDTTVKFVVTMTEEQLSQAEREGLHKKFKLDSSLHTTSMVNYVYNKFLGLISESEAQVIGTVDY